jgi:hypothetical protein
MYCSQGQDSVPVPVICPCCLLYTPCWDNLRDIHALTPVFVREDRGWTGLTSYQSIQGLASNLSKLGRTADRPNHIRPENPRSFRWRRKTLDHVLWSTQKRLSASNCC